MKGKFKTSIQLSPEAKRMVEKLSDYHGVSQSAVIEMAIREKARTDLDKEQVKNDKR